MITAEMAIVERHLARLVREQMKLVACRSELVSNAILGKNGPK